MAKAAYLLWIALLLAAGFSRNQYAALLAWWSWAIAGLIAATPPKRADPTIDEIAGMLRSKTATQWKTAMPDLTDDQLSAIKSKVAKLGEDIDASHKAAGQNAQDNAAVAQAQAAVTNAQAVAAASLATANSLADTARADLAELTAFLESLVAPPVPAPGPAPATVK